MNTPASIRSLAVVALWSLAVALSGTAVLSSIASAAAIFSEQKVPLPLAEQAKSATPVSSANPAPAQAGEMLAHTCAACHGTQGRLGDESFMPLAGMPTDQFFNTMIAFREGKRPATLMGHVARGFSDAELRAMGMYFAGIAPEKGQP